MQFICFVNLFSVCIVKGHILLWGQSSLKWILCKCVQYFVMFSFFLKHEIWQYKRKLEKIFYTNSMANWSTKCDEKAKKRLFKCTVKFGWNSEFNASIHQNIKQDNWKQQQQKNSLRITIGGWKYMLYSLPCCRSRFLSASFYLMCNIFKLQW